MAPPAPLPDLRDRTREALEGALGDADLAARFERAAYNFSMRQSKFKNLPCSWESAVFLNDYQSKVVFVLRNHEAAAREVRDNGADPDAVVRMRHAELAPERWEELKRLRDAKNELYGIKPKANTHSFKCKKCHNNECSYYEMQTRSADEPSTSFIMCLTCGNQWRMT